MFYIPPGGETAGTIVTNVVFLHNGGPRASTAIGFILGPHQRRWIAAITRTVEEYIQIGWSQFGGNESTACTATIDDVGFEAPKLIGVLSLLEQQETLPVPYRPRRLVGAICFGTRCTLQNCGFGDLAAENPVLPSTDELPLLQAAVDRALMGSSLDPADEAVMRKFFRVTELPVERLRVLFPEVSSYLQTIERQKRISMGRESLDWLFPQPF